MKEITETRYQCETCNTIHCYKHEILGRCTICGKEICNNCKTTININIPTKDKFTIKLNNLVIEDIPVCARCRDKVAAFPSPSALLPDLEFYNSLKDILHKYLDKVVDTIRGDNE